MTTVTLTLSDVELTIQNIGSDIVSTYKANGTHHFKIMKDGALVDSRNLRTDGYVSASGAVKAALRRLHRKP